MANETMKKKIFFLLCGIIAFFHYNAVAQSVTTKAITFSIEDVSDLFMPPELYVDIDFIDRNGNRILEALEDGCIRLTVSNKGGKSDAVSVFVQPDRKVTGLIFDKQTYFTSIMQNGKSVFEFPISADVDIPTDSVKFDIRVSEPMGYDIAATMILSTYEFQKSSMKVQGVSIYDYGKGLKALNGNPDGKMQKGEVVKAVVALQNVGSGEAKDVNYVITTTDPNIFLLTANGPAKELSGTLDDFLVGEAKDISFRLSANNNYSQKGRYLPVYISVREKAGFGNIDSCNVPISLGTAPEKPKIIEIKGEKDKLLAQQQTKVYSSSDRISSSIKIRDITLAPVGDPLYENAVAVVIGAEKNSYGVAPAPYAARDAKVIAEYFRTSLGIRDVKLCTDEEVTGNALSDLFDRRFGRLSNVVVPGETDVFVFYSGHGIPDTDKEGKQDVFLFPYDARKELVRERGYSLNKLYADLNSLNAKSVTVILDACFSGSSRQTATFRTENISNAKGVRINLANMSSHPWDTNPNFRVFTSSTGDQTSLGFDMSQSGLFTYFLALGLQGEADADSDGIIRMDELVDYVTGKVSAEAQKIRGEAQTPQFFGNTEMIIEKIK